MSRKYEGLIVLNTTGNEGNVDDLVSLVAKEMEASGAKLDEIDQMGRKTFAYESQHRTGGHYVTFHFEASPEQVDDIKEKLQLNDVVHTQNYLRR